MKFATLAYVAFLLSPVVACNDPEAQKDTTEILKEDSIQVSRDTAQRPDVREPDAAAEMPDDAMDAQEIVRRNFPDLRAVNPPNHPHVHVYFNPAASQVINQADTADTNTSVELRDILIARTRIDAGTDDEYVVLFNAGPSDDPTFTIRHHNRELLQVGAREMIIPGNGLVYTAGHTNTLFDERRLFRLENGKITEVAQPFLYVGLTTKTTAPITLYTDTRYRRPVTQLPKDADVMVLLNQGEHYLIKDAFGVTGWWRANAKNQTPFAGLEYVGD